MKLDFGCGDGGFMELLNNRIDRGSWLDINGGINAVGIDHRKDYILSAKKRINNGTEFIIADGRHLPFKDGCFDNVHSNGVMHHIGDYNSALMEIIRVSKTGASVYIMESVDNDPIFSFLRRLLKNWKGDDVESYFLSSDIMEKIKWHFDIISERYYWRSAIGDALAFYELEPNFSLRFNNLVSYIFKRIGLDRRFCSHFIVMVEKK